MKRNINDHCVCCGFPFTTEVRSHSSLFNSDQDWLLCPYCKEDEENAMDVEGTNNILWLYKSYLSTIEDLELTEFG